MSVFYSIPTLKTPKRLMLMVSLAIMFVACVVEHVVVAVVVAVVVGVWAGGSLARGKWRSREIVNKYSSVFYTDSKNVAMLKTKSSYT